MADKSRSGKGFAAGGKAACNPIARVIILFGLAVLA